MGALKNNMEKKLNGNYTIMLRAILNKSLEVVPHKAAAVVPLYNLDEQDMVYTAGEVVTELVSDILFSTLSHGRAKA